MLELTKKIELNWCIDEIKICAPYKIVKIPKIICNRIKKPKIFTELYKSLILFL